LRASEEELVVITCNGKPVALLLPVEDEAELDRLVLAYSQQFQTLLAEARQQIRATGGIPHADFWQEPKMESPASPDGSTTDG
jgi:antitoxin (DNA-binding transcriptional repressor) of toxin-antitoxin stability system